MNEGDAITFRRAEDSDRHAILEMLRVSLGREFDDRYSELFAWKHAENVFGPSPAWVACDGEHLAGFRTFMRWEFLDGDRVLRAVRAVDTATHPNYQGRGIFTRLTLHALEELAADGVDFVFNTPNDQSRPGYLKMGWQVVGKLPTAIRPTSFRRLPKIVKARVPAERWSTPSTAGVAARDLFEDEQGLNELLVTQAATGMRTRLSPEFFRWRFGTPLLGYRAIAAPGGLANGLVVFRIRGRGTAREAAVVCLLTRPGDRSTAAGLVREVARLADADYLLALGGARYWPGGMLYLPRVGPILTVKPVCAPKPPTNWNLSLGDIELF